MSRRRRRSDDSGLVSLIIDASKAYPLLGAILGIVFCAVGAHLMRANPKALMGLGSFAGLAAVMAGVTCFVVAGIVYARARWDARGAVARLDRTWTLEVVRGSLVAAVRVARGRPVPSRGIPG